MTIVVLNECFLTESHIKRLKALGDVKIYKDTDTEKKAIERIKNATIIIVDPFVSPLTANVLKAASQLKLIDQAVSGGDRIDMTLVTMRGITVSDIPGYSTDAVAEQTIGLLFAVARMIPYADRAMRIKPFEIDAGNPQHALSKGIELRGKTLGVIGLGKIGIRVAEIGYGLGMNILGYNRTKKNFTFGKQVSLDTALMQSDVVSLHLQYTEKLDKFIGKRELSLMKSSAILLNTAYENLIDEQALFNALKNKKIHGAGLDVIANSTINNPLLQLQNVVFSPHQGYLTDGSANNMAEMVVQNAEAFVLGQPINVLN